MYISHMLFRGALLGSALAVAALTPAAGASPSRANWERMFAATGTQSSINGASRSAPVQADPTYTMLHDFAGPSGDGANSGAAVTLDSLGNIYGTTDYGGANNAGAIFQLAPDGTQTLLHSFGGTGDGSLPDGAVTMDPSTGDMYGGTEEGGSSGYGVIYKLAADGTYTVLHSFDGINEGSWLRGHLLRDKRGNFYGTAVFGGANADGTVFKYSASGQLTVLHTFDGTDGEYPEHGVIRDQSGNFYGVTAFGGANGDGTVYEIAKDGTFSTLYSFTGGDDGFIPDGGLARDKGGNLYGSTEAAGAYRSGAVFRLAPDGTLTTLYSFTGGADGSNPEGDMLRVGTNLYSTTSGGGDSTCLCGTVFEIKANGTAGVLHTFVGGDGGGSTAGLTMSNSTFYGTTTSYGADGFGVVFSVTKK
jgi:uncharacterized repeat protein (TIGR03803 family)